MTTAEKLAQAEEFQTLWAEAYKRVSFGESYTINSGGSSRTLNRGDLKEIRQEMQYWNSEVERLSNPTTGRRTRFAKAVEY